GLSLARQADREPSIDMGVTAGASWCGDGPFEPHAAEVAPGRRQLSGSYPTPATPAFGDTPAEVRATLIKYAVRD
ncbi:hypothetical protein, partial [Streptomyces marokkonensis]|uniref:hypothetical protein n=1 Tax=Streptomyces marokkonensis TaxID=324855 RepID=UPI0031E88031